ncbi:hypothetical protein DFH08DRAFT_801644 [Mycena albidolilacea]|uniref:Uncharacterized protein n=1 Tax=Mycena albidolilacea TaxID=1033008 RepID=A0AAD7AJ18_9AGAR|nr:hypothetical protein DFH08DRAFT_801644 [Mycena albidolilacea]
MQTYLSTLKAAVGIPMRKTPDEGHFQPSSFQPSVHDRRENRWQTSYWTQRVVQWKRAASAIQLVASEELVEPVKAIGGKKAVDGVGCGPAVHESMNVLQYMEASAPEVVGQDEYSLAEDNNRMDEFLDTEEVLLHYNEGLRDIEVSLGERSACSVEAGEGQDTQWCLNTFEATAGFINLSIRTSGHNLISEDLDPTHSVATTEITRKCRHLATSLKI